MKKLSIYTSVILLLSPYAYTQSKATQSAMEELYLKNACSSCHGIYGEGVGASPRVQGVKEAILLRRLKDLQKGKTRTPSGVIMVSFAKALDENQTIEMAKYLSTLQTIVPEDRYEEPYDPHGDGGS